ncbi:DUF3106 domain-containing protein [Roseateles microcysteis]|uniref:DUF3106 domain-containing protein n=1 Tax=Roseateles microcysteis TaxID=3119057 RepID=UPI002FE65883
MTRRPLAHRFLIPSFALLLSVAVSEAALAQAEAASAPEAAPSSVAAPKPVSHASKPAPNAGGRWQGLAASYQRVLAPLQKDWDSLDPASQGKWLEVAGRYGTLPAEEQARIQQRMGEWAHMTVAERQQARFGYKGVQQIKADDRQAKWEAYQSLPPERRQELADKAALKVAQKASAPATTPGAGAGSKSNLVPAAPATPTGRPVAPSVLQAKPGATTVLITQTPTPPRHQMPGMPKLIADPSLVDPKTLLPKPSSAPAQ